ncbi:hypothetical protein VDG1235_4644 [Verrucomicrobiia bacterium DG1235]|nr:hypothetical protein VDG1235_4644 [Verrucomicrobiae bacterium DG1235]
MIHLIERIWFKHIACPSFVIFPYCRLAISVNRGVEEGFSESYIAYRKAIPAFVETSNFTLV